MVEKINDGKDLQNVSGGNFIITYDKEKKRYKLSGIMKRSGRDGQHLHRNIAEGHKCTTWFKSKKEALEWAKLYMI